MKDQEKNNRMDQINVEPIRDKGSDRVKTV